MPLESMSTDVYAKYAQEIKDTCALLEKYDKTKAFSAIEITDISGLRPEYRKCLNERPDYDGLIEAITKEVNVQLKRLQLLQQHQETITEAAKLVEDSF